MKKTSAAQQLLLSPFCRPVTHACALRPARAHPPARPSAVAVSQDDESTRGYQDVHMSASFAFDLDAPFSL